MLRQIILLCMIVMISACSGSNEPQVLPTRFILEEAFDETGETPSERPAALISTPDPANSRLAGLLDFWQPASGSLAAGSADIWHFIGREGDQITVRVIERGAKATLTLQTEDGRVLERGESITATLPENITYSVIVQAVDDGAEGGYEIGLGYADRQNPNDAIPSPLPEVVGVPTPVPAYAQFGTFISRLTSNATMGGTMEANSTDHIFTFEGAAGEFVQIEMNRVSGEVTPRLTLYDPAGIPLASDANSGGTNSALLRNILLPEDGLYSVQASGRSQPGAYSIRLLNYNNPAPVTPTVVIPPTATAIPTYSVPTPAHAVFGNRLENHMPVLSILSQPGEVAIYPFYAAQGEILTIGVSPAVESALLPEIEISDPEGNIVATAQSTASNAGGDALVTPLRAELEGTYQVYVRGQQASTGAYIISYGIGSTRLDVMQGEAPFGERNEGIINRRGIRDVWTLELQAGDIITATVNPAQASQLDPILELVPADDADTILAIDDNSGGGFSPLIRDVRITTTGLYLLRVRAAQAATTGAYTLIWRYVNIAPTSTPPPAVALLLSIDDTVPDSQYRFYPFQGRAGQRVQIRVIAREGSGFDPVAALIDPGGNVLIEVDDTEGDLNPRFIFQLPNDGTYNVRVNGYLSGGAFEVIVEELF